jgi:hypothetical protein
MQFIINLFGTVHATKDVGKTTTSGLSILDDKLRVLSNHVDFLLQQHFSRPQPCCELKTYEVYTSEDDGHEGEDREGGGQSAADDAEDDGRAEEVDADVPAGNTEAGRDGPVEGEAGAGSGEAPAGQGRTDAADSH